MAADEKKLINLEDGIGAIRDWTKEKVATAKTEVTTEIVGSKDDSADKLTLNGLNNKSVTATDPGKVTEGVTYYSKQDIDAKGFKRITLSTSFPSGGDSGDIWIRYDEE